MRASESRRQRRLEKKATLASWKGRSCGKCTACCYVLGVHELKKEPYVNCPAACGGCQIYDERPKTCRTYKCGWLVGALPDKFYPPNCGVVIDTTNPLDIVSVREVEPGASKKQEIVEFIRVAARQNVIVVIRDSEDRSLYGPRDKIERVYAEAKKRESALPS